MLYRRCFPQPGIRAPMMLQLALVSQEHCLRMNWPSGPVVKVPTWDASDVGLSPTWFQFLLSKLYRHQKKNIY